MLNARENAEAAAEHVSATDFYDPELVTVAQACFDLAGSGSPVDLNSVRHHLIVTKQTALLRRSGLSLLGNLVLEACLPGPDTIAFYAEIVAKDAQRRRVHDILTSMRQKTNDPSFDIEHVPDICDQLQAAAAPSVGTATSDALWVGDDFDDFLTDLETRDSDNRILTPWADFNAKVALRTGQLVVIGGRPGDGKSLAGLGIAGHAAIRQGAGALIASMEMQRFELMRRLLAAEAKVELDHLESKNLDDRDWQRISKAMGKVREAPLAIDSTGDMSIPHLKARIRHLSKQTPIKILVVDYLQLLKATKSAERRDLVIAEFTRGLKQIAVTQDILVIALSQLNRGPATSDRKPQMSDLRESGSIEADADTVILLHRPEAGDPDSPFAGEIELLIPKHRAGKSGRSVHLAFQGHYARLYDMRHD
jgi:replicative DNA helicase